MKFCPYCGSAHLIHLDQIAGAQSSIPSALSSTLITTVCTQLAKHARISPVVGSVLGMVISGVAVVIQEQWSNKNSSSCCHVAVSRLSAILSMSYLNSHVLGVFLMAHQIEQIAYVGETPWHGLGNQLTAHQPIEVWAQQAGMDWRIESSDVSYMAKNQRGQSIIMPFEEQRVLYRSDTHAPLSVVSQRYQEVQPIEILEFYRDLTEQSGFELETAGVLKGGKSCGH